MTDSPHHSEPVSNKAADQLPSSSSGRVTNEKISPEPKTEVTNDPTTKSDPKKLEAKDPKP